MSGAGMAWTDRFDIEVDDSTTIDTDDPYVHWFYRDGGLDKDFDRSGGRSNFDASLSSLGTLFASSSGVSLDISSRGNGSIIRSRATDATSGAFGGTTFLPAAKDELNPNKPERWEYADLAGKLPKVSEDTVIVGVIDTGIALGHRRFRDAEGNTRFIATWQQSDLHDNSEKPQRQLPIGRERYASEINQKLCQHTHGKWLDEEAFNADIGLTRPTDPMGHRDLDLRTAHGTHVLDLAAGHDPLEQDDKTQELIRRQRLIAVNLPPQHAHGTAGDFLAYYAVFGVARIVALADALAAKNNHCDGYPIVINFSYVMQAGPKDGTGIFEAWLAAFLAARKMNGQSEVRLVMPAGNDNLSQSHASVTLGPPPSRNPVTGYPAKPSVELPLRILPGDATANYVEFTSMWYEEEEEVVFARTSLSITPPNGDTVSIPAFASAISQGYYDHGSLTGCRVYYQKHLKDAQGDTTQWRFRIVIAFGPTSSIKPDATLAPAGLWRIGLRYEGPPAEFNFFIQSDQSGARSGKEALKAYFDDEQYETHVLHERTRFPIPRSVYGGVRDTYHYDLKHGPNDADNWLEYGPVQRRGTMNAIASYGYENKNGWAMETPVLAIAGHDSLTGRPAVYSSSADGDSGQTPRRTTFSASYPSETAPSLFGLLAAGARDGSVVAMRGTSMATGLATRDIAEAFCAVDREELQVTGTEKWLRDRAAAYEDMAIIGEIRDHWGRKQKWGETAELKSGIGRLGMPASFEGSRRVNRLGMKAAPMVQHRPGKPA